MNVLLIDDDDAIREGLGAFLRARGHRVRLGAGVDEALRLLRSEEFDAVVTDWHLGDDDASAIVASAHGPCIVATGAPADVVDHPAISMLLAKPVSPSRLAAVLADLASRGAMPAHALHRRIERLPSDTRDRVRVVLALLDHPEHARLDDDGSIVTVEGRISAPERWVALLEGIGGDLRVITDAGGDEEAGLRMLLRLDRRGLPLGVEVAIGPEDPWPATGTFAIDFHAAEPSPDRFLALCDRVARAWREGRHIDLVNVPSHLRMCAEAVGRADDLPIRKPSGPRLPEVLGKLWR